ncbi:MULTISPECIES: hypothetical protein [unclassified Rhodococcus (in: high G+C Gram-positive bacteria)]|uniref:hypothetical protein n=1 Tax=unclassified Rhodococcus (in: high G+C Gram-positive bacteria) TaxID=192944 RepID=UPI0011408C97|nr:MULTISPECIES: hypothetical protein [unclassified Rhodococcus (in: high G+C Gram-positive bacteria)]
MAMRQSVTTAGVRALGCVSVAMKVYMSADKGVGDLRHIRGPMGIQGLAGGVVLTAAVARSGGEATGFEGV